MPPSDWGDLGRSDPEHHIPGMKHYPDGDRTQSNVPKWLRYFASGGETLDPQERINRNTQALVATTKAAGQAFGEIADELRSFGCVNAKFDQGKVTLRFDRTISSQIDGLMDQVLPNMDHVPHFRYVEFTARIANDIMLQAFMAPMFQAQKARPLLDRILVRPQGFGQQVRNAEVQQVLRGGFVSNKTVMRLTEREIQAIKPFELPYLKKGADWDWFAKNSPRIDQLKNLHPPKDFYKELSKEFRKLNLSELQIRRTLNYSGFKTYPVPQSIPVDCSVELSKLGGGMIFRKAGTSTNQNMLVRIMPGKAKESIVSSVLKGNHLNGKMPGTLRQQYPYVVQRRGKDYLTIDGQWVDNAGATTHIPLEIYEFKGWK